MIFHHMRFQYNNESTRPSYSYSYEEKEIIRVWERRGGLSRVLRSKEGEDLRRSAKIGAGKERSREFAPSPLSPVFVAKGTRARGRARSVDQSIRVRLDARPP